MKTKPKTKNGPCHEVAPEARERGCLCCDMPPFCRNNYYTGKLLTERDLRDEQRYLIDKLRLHHLALHGWGVVCGLKVVPHPHCPELRLIIQAGQAIDGCGREILVREDKQIELPKPPEPSKVPTEPCPPEPVPPKPTPPKQQYPPRPEAQEDAAAQQTPEHPGPGPYPPTPEPGGEGEPCPPPPCPEHDLYICVRYAECETEFTPAPFDECACNGSTQKPNRICETYKIELLDEEPEDWDKIRKLREQCHLGDCADLYKTMLEPCLKPGWPECIPIAVIRGYAPGKKVTEEMIDNWEYRPLLPSTWLLDQLIRCILDKLPTRELTHIRDTNWSHDQEYNCRKFLQTFVGDTDDKAFRVTFSRPVRTEGLSPRSFQAIIVRQAKKGQQGGFMEVAPAEVWASDDRLNFYLRLDKTYAERLLQDASFDVYLTLRCNVIVDDHGLAVDGNLLARLRNGDYDCDVPPDTGDGIPGGTFESWIRVIG